MAGSLLTEGQHIYLNNKHPKINQAIQEMFDVSSLLMKKHNASTLMLRDFEDNNHEMDKFMLENGFFKTEMPIRNVIESMDWKDDYEFSMTLQKKYRKHFRAEVLKHSDKMICDVVDNPSFEQINNWKNLYKQIKNNSLKLNTFDLPNKLFQQIHQFRNWEILSLKLSENQKEVAVVFNYISGNVYNAMFIGIDKSIDVDFSIYRMALYHVIKRAKHIGSKSINLGFTASLEKRRFGAIAYPTVAYMQTEDDYNASVIESIQIISKQNHNII